MAGATGKAANQDIANPDAAGRERLMGSFLFWPRATKRNFALHAFAPEHRRNDEDPAAQP
jgi:hypothetical protein